MVWHLAVNSDIRAGSADPEVDLRNSFLTTFNVLKIVKLFRIPPSPSLQVPPSMVIIPEL
jgi:hypothetical protein